MAITLSAAILDWCLRKTRADKSRDYRDVIVFEKLRFQNVFRPHLGPVHTNPFSNENGTVLVRIRLSSTLQRRKRSPKTEPFKNALQSGAIWKRCFLKTLFSRVDGGCYLRHDQVPDHSTVSIQIGANFAGRYLEMHMHRVHLSVRTDGLKAFSKRIRRCSVDRWKWYENDKCGRKSFRKWSKTAPFSFGNGFVWTGPNSAQFYRTYRLNLHRQLNTVQLRNKRKKFSNKIGSELGSSK